jgi:hypothetical protein
MGKIFKINESDIKRIVKVVMEQETQSSQDEWVKVSPEQYLDIMKYASYNAKGVSMLPQYRGKKIWITGNLDVSKTPIKTLDGIGYVEGNLDISNTDIVDVSHIQVSGRVRDYDSGKSRLEAKRIRNKKLEESKERRESGEWDLTNPDIDDEGIYANAVLEFIEGSNYTVNIRQPEDDERLSELQKIIEDLLEKEKKYDEEGKDLTDVYADIEAAEEEIEEINEKFDLYDLVPMNYDHYEMKRFEVVGNDDLEGYEFAVGTENEVHNSAVDALQQQIDEGITNFFNESFLENHIDEEQVLDYFRESYEDDIRQNPDVYFNEDDFELTAQQEHEKTLIEAEIEEYEERLENLNDEIEDPDEYSTMYDQIQEHIDSLQERLDEIVPDTDEPTDDMVEDALEDRIRDVRRNLISYMKDYGMEIADYVDTDKLIEDVIDMDGYGSIINSYDGTYDTSNVGDKYLYVMRIS